MDPAEGMMAVVRALPHAGLAMSLLDGNRQYTLMPKEHVASVASGVQTGRSVRATTYVPAVPVQHAATDSSSDRMGTAHSHGTQAVDGRYASVYQMAHCHVHPTSPPVQLTEFPPQRAELSRGQGNFEVGGVGSGETNASPTRLTQSFRGGMNWPDRSVYTPRQSYHYEPDLFAESLRKYPILSSDRSAEVVERLINYTQMKTTCSKQSGKYAVSPTRSEACPGQGADRRSYAATSFRTAKVYEPEVCIRSKVLDESPTRDTCQNVDYETMEYKRSLYERGYDVRYFREVNRRAKESVRNTSTYPYSHTICPPIKERYDHLPPKNNVLEEIISINSVHMETQAEIPMVSREVTTVPKVQPSMRNVAVPLSPPSSQSDFCKLIDFEDHDQNQFQAKLSNKSIQTIKLTDFTTKPQRSVYTCVSSIDLAQENKVKTCRKTKSQEEIRIKDDLEEELFEVIKDLSIYTDLNTSFNVRNALLRKLLNIYRTERSDRVKVKLGRCVRDQFYSHIDSKNFTKELSDELMAKIQAKNVVLKCYNSINTQKTDAASGKNNSHKCIEEIVKEWLNYIPVKSVDYLERPVTKELVLNTVASKIKLLIEYKMQHEQSDFLKPDILDILEDLPLDVNSLNRNSFLNVIASDLVRKIQDVISINVVNRKIWEKAKKGDRTPSKDMYAYAYVLPDDNELKQFVKEELKEFTTKFQVEICPSTEKDILIELIDLLADSLDALRYGEDEKVREEILILLSDFINLSKNESTYFVNSLVYNFKDLLKNICTENIKPHKFVILQDTVDTVNTQTIDTSIKRKTNRNFKSKQSEYTQLLVEQIVEWMENIEELRGLSAELKKIVAHDLAEDIVHRQKYLELNSGNNNSDYDELEVLKYQIFKWINKLVEEKSLETTEHAYRLMQRIRNIPVTMVTKPAVTVMNMETRVPKCSKKDVESLTSEQSSSDCPIKITCQDSEMNSEQRKQNCICTISYDIIRKKCNQYCVAEVDTKNLGIMTDQDQMKTDSSCCPIDFPLKKTAQTETDMLQMTRTCSTGTTINLTEYVKAEHITDKRNRFPSKIGANSKAAERIALVVSTCSIGQQNTPKAQSPHKPLCCVVGNKDLNQTSTVKDLNDEYDQYLQNWVSQIPIITSKPEEQALIETMRKGIYNGVWKVRTKIQMNPNAMENRYYYQDLFDDELEELLDLLPKSSELIKNKQILKNQLIEKTINVNEQINTVSAHPSYRQQLVDNIGNHIPRKKVGFTDSDIAKTCEDIHKLNIAETFIMFTMYRDRDNVKANVYKKKLMKYIQEFFENLKKTRGTDVKNVDYKLYKDEILHALYGVSQPTDETIMEEADEVLVGLEIEQWFSDLPLYPTDSSFEILCRKRYRDTLAKKVHEMEKQHHNLANCEEELRHEITRFMGKLPIRENEIQNMPFMVEELVNRLKNRSNDLVLGSEKRRLLPLTNPFDYDEFSRHMQLCSSFSDDPDAKKPQMNESSYIIRGGERVTDENNQLAGEYGFVHFRGDTPNSTQNWISMHGDEDFPPIQDSNIRQRQQEQELHTPVQNPPDCCKLQNGTAKNQTIPQNNSYRQSQREMTMRGEQSPYTSQLQYTRFSGSSAEQAASPERRSSRPLQDISMAGTCVGPTCPEQRQMTPREPSLYISRPQETQMPEKFARPLSPQRRPSMMPREATPYKSLQDTQMPGTCPGRSYREERPVMMPREPTHTSRLQETHFSGTCAGPSAPDRRFPERSGFQENFATGRFPGNICPRSEEGRTPTMDHLEATGPSYGPEVSTRPCDDLCPGSSQEQFSSRQTPSGFSGQPVCNSTPQQSVPPPHISRPKKRTVKMDRSKRDAVRKRLEMTDSDDSDSEEICRCMERFWKKCRKRRPVCEDCDMDYPPCFPLRFAYPYYF